MKKVFFLLFASAVFSIGGCKSAHHDKDDEMDSTEMRNQVNQAMDSVSTMQRDTMRRDSMHPMGDTVKR